MAAVKNFSGPQIRNILKYDELILGVEDVLASFSARNKTVVQPLRSVVEVKQHNGLLAVMPCFLSGHGSLATKLVTVYPDNKTAPSHNAVILLHNHLDGQLMAMMDGDVITEMRTAAASAVSAKYLAHPDSTTLAILGAGVQGTSHYHAIASLFNITNTRVYSRTISSAQKLASEAVNGQVFDNIKDAVQGADMIAVTLFTDTPVLYHDWVKPGAHIMSIGAIGEGLQEIDPVLMRSAVVYADSHESAMKETGDVTLSGAEIYAEIGEVINGTKEARVQSTTVFKSLGLACEDAISAKMVYDKMCSANTSQSRL